MAKKDNLKVEILKILKNSEYVSGEEMSKMLNVSRMAVCKHIQSLNKQGYIIKGITNKGYTMEKSMEKSNVYDFLSLKSSLNTKVFGKDLEFLEEVDSTNNYAKGFLGKSDSHGKCIVAKKQSKGRGRNNSNFYSPNDTGVYMTLVVSKTMSISTMYKYLLCVASGVALAIEELTQSKAQVKWPCDIVIGGEKVCGMLFEAVLDASTGEISDLILGIGINVSNQMNKENMGCNVESNVDYIVSSIQGSTGIVVDKCLLFSKVMSKIEEVFIKEEELNTLVKMAESKLYKKGKTVEIIQDKQLFKGTLFGIDKNGALLLKEKRGKLIRLERGEMTNWKNEVV